MLKLRIEHRFVGNLKPIGVPTGYIGPEGGPDVAVESDDGRVVRERRRIDAVQKAAVCCLGGKVTADVFELIELGAVRSERDEEWSDSEWPLASLSVLD